MLYLSMYKWVILFLIIPNSIFCQEIFNSEYSIHIPTGIRENITRVITIDRNKILIESNTGSGITDTQILVIQYKETYIYNDITYTVYQCTSTDGVFNSLVTLEENPLYIEVIQPSKWGNQQDVFHLFLTPNL